MAKITPRIRDTIFDLKFEKGYSLRRIQSAVKELHKMNLSPTAISNLIKNDTHIEGNVIMTHSTLEESLSKEARGLMEYDKQNKELNTIKLKCSNLLNKALDRLLLTPCPEEHIYAISKILNDIMKYEHKERIDIAKHQLDLNRFDFEKSKTVIDDSGNKYNIQLVNDVGVNDA